MITLATDLQQSPENVGHASVDSLIPSRDLLNIMEAKTKINLTGLFPIPTFPGYYADREGGIWSTKVRPNKRAHLQKQKEPVLLTKYVVKNSRQKKNFVVKLTNEFGVNGPVSVAKLIALAFLGVPLQNSRAVRIKREDNFSASNIRWEPVLPKGAKRLQAKQKHEEAVAKGLIKQSYFVKNRG